MMSMMLITYVFSLVVSVAVIMNPKTKLLKRPFVLSALTLVPVLNLVVSIGLYKKGTKETKELQELEENYLKNQQKMETEKENKAMKSLSELGNDFLKANEKLVAQGIWENLKPAEKELFSSVEKQYRVACGYAEKKLQQDEVKQKVLSFSASNKQRQEAMIFHPETELQSKLFAWTIHKMEWFTTTIDEIRKTN